MRKFAVVIALLAAASITFVVWSQHDEPMRSPRDGARDVSTVGTEQAAAPQRHSDEVVRTSAADTATLARDDPEELRGRVVIAGTATPIVGAAVVLLQIDVDELYCLAHLYREETTTLGRATSAADGTFRFAVARARLHRLEVRAGGYASTILSDCMGGAEVLVELSRGAVVEGIVSSDGVGVADVPVRVVAEHTRIELAKGRSNSDGTFRFYGLQPGESFVQACSPRHAEDREHLELESGRVHRVDLEVKAGISLRGRVIDAETRLPIADAQVFEEWSFRDPVLTDAEGRFAVGGHIEHQAVELTVRKAGYALAAKYKDQDLDVEIEVALARGAEATGRIVDGAGQPLPASYAGVAAAYQGVLDLRVENHDWVRAIVAGDGRFVVKGLHPSLDYWLFVRCAGFGTRVYALARRLDDGQRLDVGDVVMRPAGGIEGRVTDGDGLPVAGASIEVSGVNADSRAWIVEGTRPPPAGHLELRLIDGDPDPLPKPKYPLPLAELGETFRDTDSNGCFRFTGLATGEYHITVRLDRRRYFTTKDIAVRDGEIAASVNFVVPAATMVEGELRYADGRALGDEAADVRLVALGESWMKFSAKPEKGGRFRFQGLDHGYPYTVLALRAPPGWAMQWRNDVVGGTKDLDLVLERSAFVAGRVVDAQGRGTRARVWAHLYRELGGCDFESHLTAQDGTFRLEVPPGFHGSIMASAGSGARDMKDSDGVAAGQSDVLIQLPFGH